VQAARQMG